MHLSTTTELTALEAAADEPLTSDAALSHATTTSSSNTTSGSACSRVSEGKRQSSVESADRQAVEMRQWLVG